MLKKKIEIAIIVFCVVLGIQMMSYAATGTITGETVKLRSGASMEAKLVTLLSVNNKVEVIEKDGEWYKVEIDGKTGYVNSGYIKVEGEVPEAGNENEEPESSNTTSENITTEQPIEEPEDTQPETVEQNQENVMYPKQMIVSEKTVVRVIPLIQAMELGNIEENTKVMATEEINGWIYINSEFFSGWIRKEKLVEGEQPLKEKNLPEEPEQKPEEPKDEPEKKQETRYVNVDTVNLRKEPNTDCEVIDNVTLNTSVIVQEEENNWSKVTVGGKTGYIASKYLSEKKIEITNRSSEVDRMTAAKEKEDTKEEEPVSNVDAADTTIRSDVVSYAKTFLGVPYVSGGSTPNGFDCSGFTQYVFRHFGKSISRTTTGQAKNGTYVERDNLKLGDIILFQNGGQTGIGHVGIYVGSGSFIHASSPGDVVKITSLSMEYYSKRYVTARRIL